MKFMFKNSYNYYMYLRLKDFLFDYFGFVAGSTGFCFAASLGISKKHRLSAVLLIPTAANAVTGMNSWEWYFL